MRTAIRLSIVLLYTSIAQCSQIEPDSIIGQILQEYSCSAVTGRALAERHAWWIYKHERGPIPELSSNQLGQYDIRYPNTPIADSDYDTLFIPAALADHLAQSTRTVTICGPEKDTKTTWVNAGDFTADLRYPAGSKKNPINL